jgi:hypothetical protein
MVDYRSGNEDFIKAESSVKKSRLALAAKYMEEGILGDMRTIFTPKLLKENKVCCKCLKMIFNLGGELT